MPVVVKAPYPAAWDMSTAPPFFVLLHYMMRWILWIGRMYLGIHIVFITINAEKMVVKSMLKFYNDFEKVFKLFFK
jgi:hypothetical protein